MKRSTKNLWNKIAVGTAVGTAIAAIGGTIYALVRARTAPADGNQVAPATVPHADKAAKAGPPNKRRAVTAAVGLATASPVDREPGSGRSSGSSGSSGRSSESSGRSSAGSSEPSIELSIEPSLEGHDSILGTAASRGERESLLGDDASIHASLDASIEPKLDDAIGALDGASGALGLLDDAKGGEDSPQPGAGIDVAKVEGLETPVMGSARRPATGKRARARKVPANKRAPKS